MPYKECNILQMSTITEKILYKLDRLAGILNKFKQTLNLAHISTTQALTMMNYRRYLSGEFYVNKANKTRKKVLYVILKY